MPYPLFSPLLWLKNVLSIHPLVQSTVPSLMAEVILALNEVIRCQRQISNVKLPLDHNNSSKPLSLTLHVQAHSVGLQPQSVLCKSFYIVAISLIAFIIDHLICHVRLLLSHSREMQFRTPDELQYLSASLSSQPELLLIAKPILSIMESMQNSTLCYVIYGLPVC